MGELLSSDAVIDVVGAYRLSAAVVAMADLGVPDALAQAPATSATLAAMLDVDESLLDRLLKMLASRGALACDDEGRYSNSGLSGALIDGELRDMVLGWAALPSVYTAWSCLGESIRSGSPPFVLAHQTDLHGLFAAHPGEADRYATAMGSTVEGFEDMAAAIDLSGRDVVVSVGGGRGVELVPLLRRWPHVRGILADLPDAVAGANEVLAGYELADRVEIMGGDARLSVPPGDAYVLSTVLRCLPRPHLIAVLRACREAATGPQTTLNVVEMIMADGGPTHPDATADLTAWVAYGGADHTVGQWRELLADGGWHLDNVVSLTAPFSLIICTPSPTR